MCNKAAVSIHGCFLIFWSLPCKHGSVPIMDGIDLIDDGLLDFRGVESSLYANTMAGPSGHRRGKCEIADVADFVT